MVSLANSHSNATSWRQHLWKIDLRFAPGLPPGRTPKPLYGYLAHKKTPPLRTTVWPYAEGYCRVQGGLGSRKLRSPPSGWGVGNREWRSSLWFASEGAVEDYSQLNTPGKYKGTSPTRNCHPLGPYSWSVPRGPTLVLGGGKALMSKVPLQCARRKGRKRAVLNRGNGSGSPLGAVKDYTACNSPAKRYARGERKGAFLTRGDGSGSLLALHARPRG